MTHTLDNLPSPTNGDEASNTRPIALCRTWLFTPGLSSAAQTAALDSGADVIVLDLEEFTAAADRPEARARMPAFFDTCRARGIVAAVRINMLEHDGLLDLAGIMAGQPDFIFLPHAESTAQIVALDEAIAAHERTLGIPLGRTAIVPTLESALGVMRTYDILTASPRAKACLLAAEDLSADLGVERAQDGLELHALRARFLVDCTAARSLPIDCPYNYRDAHAQRADLTWARRIGFKAKCVVYPEQVQVVHDTLTPSQDAVAQARARVARFEDVNASDHATRVDPPDYHTARRLLARHAQFDSWQSRTRD